MANTIQRQASPARWHRAVERAMSEGIQVRQLAGSGAWIATSGSDSSTAYELDVTGEIAHGCSCLAGLNGDSVCKHRAAFYLAVGVLDPEPEPPAAPALAPCGYCWGRGWETVVGKSGTEYRFACQVCDGTGTEEAGEDDEPSSLAAGLAPVAPAPSAPAACGRCGGADTLTMTVAGGCGLHAVTIGCKACHGTGMVGMPAPAIAA